LLYALAVGWVWTLSHLRTSLADDDVETAPTAAVRAAASVAAALTSISAPSTAYLTEATLNAIFDRERGISGKLRAAIDTSGTPVSEHFTLRDFLTHDQPNVWPKYLVLQIKLIDKLELVLVDLEAHGVDISGVRVMSGFRTPQYNVGGGNTAGRAELSRHMYGDAADIFI